MVRVLYLIENGSAIGTITAHATEVCTLRMLDARSWSSTFEDEGLKETMDGNVEVYRYRYPSFGKASSDTSASTGRR